MIRPEFIDRHNRERAEAHERDLAHLAGQMSRRGLDIEPLIDRVADFEVAIPSWALGTGGTRFGRFPGPGEPRNVYEKMEDIAVLRNLTVSASHRAYRCTSPGMNRTIRPC